MSYTKADIRRLTRPRRHRMVLLLRLLGVAATAAVAVWAAVPALTIATPVLRNWTGELNFGPPSTVNSFARPPLGWVNSTSVSLAASSPSPYDRFFFSSSWSEPFGFYLYGQNSGGQVFVKATDSGNFSAVPYTANVSVVGSYEPNGSLVDYVYLHDCYYWDNLTVATGTISAWTTGGPNYTGVGGFVANATVPYLTVPSNIQILPASPGSRIELVGASLNLSAGGQHPTLNGRSSIVISNFTKAGFFFDAKSQVAALYPRLTIVFGGPVTLAFRKVNGSLTSDEPRIYSLLRADLWITNASEIDLTVSPVPSSGINYMPKFELIAAAGIVRLSGPNLPAYPGSPMVLDPADQTERLYGTITLLGSAAVAGGADVLLRASRRFHRRR